MTGKEDILVGWYVGELGGNALFSRLRDVATPDAARKWAALGRVERRVADWLAALLYERNIRAQIPLDIESRAQVRCDLLAGKSWTETMHWLRDIAAHALHRMSSDAQHLPIDLAAAGDLVVRHEQALLDFAELELANRSSDALRCIEIFLDSV